MRRLLRFVFPAVLALAFTTSAMPATATHNADKHRNMNLLFTSANFKTNSDLAFWGNHAFQGYYTGDSSPSGGFRIFDISNPAVPVMIKDVSCDGLQNDPIVWDRDGDGIADLLLLAVDRTMANSACGAPRVAHDDPTGWEGVRVFTMTDNPANPFATVTQVAGVYTDCGAHTITAFPDLDNNRLMVYVSSYPLRPGPTCGPVNGPPAGEDPLHKQISVIEVPLFNPGASSVVAEPPISYPGDPDGFFEPCERGTGACAPGVLINGLVACHDIAVDVRLHLAAAACAEQGQLWTVDGNGMPDTANPIWVSDDEVSSGGTGDIPGAIDFFHSATFSKDGSVVNWIDESFAPAPGFDECPPTTDWAARAWHPAGTHETGRMFFVDGASGAFLSEFQVGDLRPEPGAYCSAHMGLPVPGSSKDLLVNAWYMGGVDVVDFTNPTRLREAAYYDIAPDGTTGSDNWSAYSYVGPKFGSGPDIPIYATDGVHNPPTGRGLLVFRASVGKTHGTLGHLNPQTQE
jgi:hypothetical protein